MSIIVDYSYKYWNDGTSYVEQFAEYDSEQEATTELGYMAWIMAFDDTVTINRVIGGGEGVVDRIRQGVDQYVVKKKREKEIYDLKESIKRDHYWLDSMHDEMSRRTAQIRINIKRLVEIDNEDRP
jgi:hypothetical protein